MHEDSYIRGGGPVRLDGRRLGARLAVATVVLLAICSIVLAVMGASGTSTATSIRRHGVPVRATVTSCTGITSGIGMGAEYYQCRGAFMLGGQTFDAVIHGTRAQLAQGTVVDALVVPSRPSSLSLAGEPASSSIPRYTASIVLGAVALIGAAGLALLRFRRRGRMGPV